MLNWCVCNMTSGWQDLWCWKIIDWNSLRAAFWKFTQLFFFNSCKVIVRVDRWLALFLSNLAFHLENLPVFTHCLLITGLSYVNKSLSLKPKFSLTNISLLLNLSWSSLLNQAFASWLVCLKSLLSEAEHFFW